MTNPNAPKRNSSEPSAFGHLGKTGAWYEFWGNTLLIIGPRGLVVTLTSKTGKSLDIKPENLIAEPGGKVKISGLTNVTDIMFGLGNIRQLSWSGQIIGSILRRYPQYLAANYRYQDNRQQILGYYDWSVNQAITITLMNAQVWVDFSTAGIHAQPTIWNLPPADDYRHMQISYFISQIFLANEDWQDPRGWLEFIRRDHQQLHPEFIRQVGVKLLQQFDNDWQPKPQQTKLSRAALRRPVERSDYLGKQFTAVAHYKLRQAWWLAHFEVILQLALLADLYPPSQARRLFKPLYLLVEKELATASTVTCNLNLELFNHQLPLGVYPAIYPGLTPAGIKTLLKRYRVLESQLFPSWKLSDNSRLPAIKIGQNNRNPNLPSRIWPTNVADCLAILDNIAK